MSNRKSTNGFTLIELLVVVAIIAILAAVAYPSYARFIERTHRADGREMILRVAAAQERFYTNRNSYSTALTTDLGFSSTTSEKAYYDVAATIGAGGQTYLITATPQGFQASDPCANLTINNVGLKSFTGAETNGSCW